MAAWVCHDMLVPCSCVYRLNAGSIGIGIEADFVSIPMSWE